MKVCNGVCKQYKFNKTKIGWFKAGAKRCDICVIFMKWDGLKCPCCHNKLSTSRRKMNDNVKRIE